jgi:hypothetical protein
MNHVGLQFQEIHHQYGFNVLPFNSYARIVIRNFESKSGFPSQTLNQVMGLHILIINPYY